MDLDLKKIFDHKKTLLIQGETGVGKTSYVQHLQACFASDESLVYLNLATLGEDLFCSQLFGHKRGAFTGADKDFIGFAEQASHGTLFLDEISEISLNLQKKLLSLLEERVFYPLGSTKPLGFQGRIVLATHKNLEELVNQGLFRKDLYYRICRFEVYLPPLREQRNQVYEKMNSLQIKICRELFEFLVHKYCWPGNYRELKNFIDFCEYQNVDKRLTFSDMPRWMNLNQENDQTYQTSSNQTPLQTYYEALEKFEKSFLGNSMHYYGGRVNYASDKLGLSKSTLIAKLKKYGINTLKIRAMSQEKKESDLKVA